MIAKPVQSPVFNLRPDALWTWCEQMVAGGHTPHERCLVTKRAMCYLRSRETKRSARVESGPLARAHQIYLANSTIKDELEARLCGDQPASEIVEKMAPRCPDMSVHLVRVYSKLFFAIGLPCLYLNVPLAEAIGVYPGKMMPITEGEIWRYTAFVSGTDKLDILVDDYHGSASDANRRAEWLRFVARDWCIHPSDHAGLLASLAEAAKLLPLDESDAEKAFAREFKKHAECLKLILRLRINGQGHKRRARKSRTVRVSYLGGHTTPTVARSGPDAESVVAVGPSATKTKPVGSADATPSLGAPEPCPFETPDTMRIGRETSAEDGRRMSA